MRLKEYAIAKNKLGTYISSKKYNDLNNAFCSKLSCFAL